MTALDASGNTATSYSGTVHFTSTDGQAVLPANSNLTNGARTFSVTLKSADSQTITATDTTTPSITGTSNSISVGSGAATHLSVAAPAAATTGISFNFTVTALDAWNNTVTTYTETVRFTSSAPHAVLPANSPLANGTAGFSATLNTAGSQTIMARDTATSLIGGYSNAIQVSGGFSDSDRWVHRTNTRQ